MFESFETEQQLFVYELGSALTMERTVLEMLGELARTAEHAELEELLRHHAEETREHVQRVQECFGHLGEDVADSPCPAIDGLWKAGRSTIDKARGRVVDSAIIGAAVQTEHHEIAVYESLITRAEAHQHAEVARLLRDTLEQEQHALDAGRAAGERLARESTLAA